MANLNGHATRVLTLLACGFGAIACGASTIYRNYFGLDGAPQTASSQIDAQVSSGI